MKKKLIGGILGFCFVAFLVVLAFGQGESLFNVSSKFSSGNFVFYDTATAGTIFTVKSGTNGILVSQPAEFDGAVDFDSTAKDSNNMPIFSGVFSTATAKTADYSIQTTDSGGLFTNVGDTVGQTLVFTLPAVAAGYTWTCANLVTGCTVEVDCDGSDKIVGLTDAAGNKVQSITAPAWISFVAVDATNIAVIQRTGAWTDAN